MPNKLKTFIINRHDAKSLFHSPTEVKTTASFKDLVGLLEVTDVDTVDRVLYAKVDVLFALVSSQPDHQQEILKLWRPDSDRCSVLVSAGRFYADTITREEAIKNGIDIDNSQTFRILAEKTNLFLFSANLASALASSFGEFETRFRCDIVTNFLSSDKATVILLRKSGPYLSYDPSEDLQVIVLYPVAKENIYPEFFFQKVKWEVIDRVADDCRKSPNTYNVLTHKLLVNAN